MVEQVRKRDGSLEPFDQRKITAAISKAFRAVRGRPEVAVSRHLSDEIVSKLQEASAKKVPSVEEIQDMVEEGLMEKGYTDVAKSYILYRVNHSEARQYKAFVGVDDDLKLGVNAIKVLQSRYLRRDPGGKVVETPSQMFRRVAHAVAKVDGLYGKEEAEITAAEERFYEMMASMEFLPNSPTLMNAGTRLGQLSACFVIPVRDSLESIFDAVKAAAIIHQSGGGTGFSFSNLRPKGDVVQSTGGTASGPISFMKIFDATTEEVKQGGRRRGANMAILTVHHPDIMDFVTVKSRANLLTNFNLSVAVDDEFMKAVEKNRQVDLINPRDDAIVGRTSARELFSLICTGAWQSGDPGLVFIDEVNRRNPTPGLGRIEATNPCGEVPLLPYESCNLGSINVSLMVSEGRMDWKRLEQAVRDAVHFLDNIIDANKYTLKQVKKMSEGNRKIGLGVMGFAEALIKLGISYDSDDAVAFARKLMAFIGETSHKASAQLGLERGSFPNFEGSTWEKRGYRAMRNATTTTIAPTGSISIIAGCSSGIEPLFAVSFVRDVMEGTRLLEVNPFFEKAARERGFYSPELMMRISQTGSVGGIEEVPQDLRRLFVTALEIPPERHLRIQAAFQEYTDNAVSKTINIPHDANPDSVHRSYMLAWRLKCKGITVYRYGSKAEQVLYIGTLEKGGDEKYVIANSEYAGGCVGTVCPS
jgi:ribonucleoside-diphosphate reductase alpha chain